jgi:CheY-like chemotaxis protein
MIMNAAPPAAAPPLMAGFPDFIVLVAEDNMDDGLLLQMALKKAGLCRVPIVVRDGVDAINYLAGREIYADRTRFPFPNLMFLDLGLPRMNGFQVLEWWRTENHAERLCIIVLTASMVRSDLERAYQLGAFSFLRKPDEFRDLTQLMERTLESWLNIQKTKRV